MKNCLKMAIVGLAFLGLFLMGCTKDRSVNVDQYTEATITHDGFDFSIADTGEYPTCDGETIMWQPGGATHPDYPNNDAYLWWRNTHLDTVAYDNMTKDMGAVDISTVSTVPTEWDTIPMIPPLLEGHTIVARCYDGYVKFQVLSTDTSGGWPVEVKYYYSESSTFDH